MRGHLRRVRYPDLLIKDGGVVVNVPDIKSSWDIHTFIDAKANELSKDYYWQGQAYMWLTGATTATFCFVLVNAPLQMIDDEKYRLARRMNLIDPQGNEEFIKFFITKCVIPSDKRMFRHSERWRRSENII